MVFFQILKNRFGNIFRTSSFNRRKTLTDVLNDSFFRLDEITCNDCSIKEINLKLNNNHTTFGDELFDHWLKNIKNYDDLIMIQNDTKLLFESNKRHLLEKGLKKVGKQFRGHIVSDLWNGFEVGSFIVRNIIRISLLNISFFILMSLILESYIIIWLLIFAIVSMTMYINTNTVISRFSGSINYLLFGIKLINKMKKEELDILSIKNPDFPKFKYLQWCTLLFKDGIASANSENPISLILDYLRIFLNLEAISFNITSKVVIKNINDVRDIIYFIGYYDCILNNVKIIENFDTSFTKFKTGRELQFVDMYHPLIAKPVKQSKRISSGLIITGLNMAGKSTFMKTIVINQLLSTSLGICFAKEMTTDIFKIITSFRINDVLLENKSRYFAEAERIAFIIKNIGKGKYLCLIDEILSGTNSKDRIYGSIEILKKLAQSEDSLVISATHDLEIANSLSELYESGYFDGKIENENIVFDYILKSGVVPDKNGLLILRLLGIDV